MFPFTVFQLRPIRSCPVRSTLVTLPAADAIVVAARSTERVAAQNQLVVSGQAAKLGQVAVLNQNRATSRQVYWGFVPEMVWRWEAFF